MMKGMLLSLYVLISMTACSMPETKIYSLALPDTVIQDLHSRQSYASLVIITDAPRHLSQPYIVSRISPYQLHISRYAKWESPPDEIVRKAVQDTLTNTGRFHEVKASSLISDRTYVLEISLKRFEKTGDGNEVFGELAFDMKFVSPDNRELSHAVIARRVKLGDVDFLNLAKGMSTALAEAVQEVKAKVIVP